MQSDGTRCDPNQAGRLLMRTLAELRCQQWQPLHGVCAALEYPSARTFPWRGRPTQDDACDPEAHHSARAVRSASKPILRMISQGRFDRYASIPQRSPDEAFHHVVTDMLRDWQRQHSDSPTVVTVVDQQQTPRAYQIRDLLQRGGLPFAFHTPDSPEGEVLLRRIGRPAGPFPVLVRYDGHVLINPGNEEIALALGVRHASVEGVFDVVVIGSGPAGLSAAVYARPRKDCAPSSSIVSRSEGRPAPVPSSATTWDSPSASTAPNCATGPWTKPGPSERRPP